MTALLHAPTPASPLPEGPGVPCWDSTDTQTLRVRTVTDVTADVKTFVFEPPDGQYFSFEAGQFITLDLEIDGARIERSYTISSPPTRPHRLSITVKRIPDGTVSGWLHDTVVPGTELKVRAPLGAFTLTDHPAPSYLLLSAGVGITPTLSMVRTLADLAEDTDVTVVHCARTPLDLIHRAELEALARQMPRLRVAFVCGREHPNERWFGPTGRITAAALQTLVPDLHDRETFVCGPEGYMDTVRLLLTDLGYDMARHHEESFDFTRLTTPPPAPDTAASAEPDTPTAEAPPGAAEPTGLSVEFVRSGRTVECAPGQTVLEAGQAAGLRLPSSCGQGLCGTCKISLLAGEVDMQHNGGIRPKEIKQGKALMCCSKPLGDLQIDA
ncbi:hybrid-cluster NAD(P)-dependent oxidoreductase [Brevibacterium samyangense]|uniref:Hybrid-cluster NAD(P)-dependent oxidoreductase n=1 Tax=Brevibacterium samyangense TaxID=366888 RepID=A0ABP5ESE0_9MICO